MAAGGEDGVQRSAHFSVILSEAPGAESKAPPVILSEAPGAESKDPLNSPESVEHGTFSGFGGSLDSLAGLAHSG